MKPAKSGLISILSGSLLLAALWGTKASAADDDRRHESRYLKVELAADAPAFTTLSVDSLGTGKLSINPVLAGAAAETGYRLRRRGDILDYLADERPVWSFQFAERSLRVRSQYQGKAQPPLVVEFDPHICHATLLGIIEADGRVRLPALLHLPDLGTFRISSSRPVTLGYEAIRFTKRDYVRISFPAASEAAADVRYTWEVAAIYPAVKGIEDDPRFNGFRRNFINIFQLNPSTRTLANHAASDPCAFTLYEYADVAVHTPPLAPGVTALGMLRQTLERYLEGMKAYGLVGYKAAEIGRGYRYPALDSYPSLVISAADYVKNSGDRDWLRRHYRGIQEWIETMAAFDSNGDGLLEHPLSGNAGVLRGPTKIRPSNWWDTIGFGHQDAYANALAYRAFRDAADMARMNGDRTSSGKYAQKAEHLRAQYYTTFFNPKTGVLAGWKSADGQLHDYYFTFVNGIAVAYGLAPADKAAAIMDAMLARMRDQGYSRFEFGLPGNLIPVRQEDYMKSMKRWGAPDLADGSDAFQIYENGGATACHAYFTLQALYAIGKRAEADRILFPMLAGFEDGGFQGRGANGLTKDWKSWDGTPRGYEGILVDNYYTFLAVLTGWANSSGGRTGQVFNEGRR